MRRDSFSPSTANCECLRYGPAQNSRWVVWGHDIFGPESGRAREYCALLASTLNLTCIIPDFFRGNIPDFIPVPGGNPIPTWADTLQRDWVELLLPYLGQAGAQQVIPVGTCYGSYVVVHAAAESGGLVTGGVSIHPSHPPLMAMNGEDEAAVYRNISSPQYFMATPGDSDTVRPGGLASSIMQTVGSHFQQIITLALLFCRQHLTSTRLPALTASSLAAT